MAENASPSPRGAKPVVENVAESATACLLAMVQGNVFALGGGGRWAVAGALAVATSVVDFFMHPGGLGPGPTLERRVT